jgi:glycosyltransferase involved in cell wall biosynthesis
MRLMITKTRPRVTLIIPAYNEASVIVATVGTLTATLATTDFDWEIIVVDNASTDGTGALVQQLGHERVRAILLAEKGKGRAVRAGFAKAEGDVIGFTDADLSVEPSDIVSGFERVLAGECDALVGSRLHPESKMPGREWWRIGSSHIFNALARTIVGVPVSDTQCPLKVMNTSAVTILLSTKEEGWFFDLEFFALASRLALVVREVPVIWNEHRYPGRRSKLSTTRDGLRAIVAMFRIRARLPAQLSVLPSAKIET